MMFLRARGSGSARSRSRKPGAAYRHPLPLSQHGGGAGAHLGPAIRALRRLRQTLTREVNKQIRDRMPKLSDIETPPTWTAWASISRRSRQRPTRPITDRAGLGIELRANVVNDRLAEIVATGRIVVALAPCRCRTSTSPSPSSSAACDSWGYAAWRSIANGMDLTDARLNLKFFAKAQALDVVSLHPIGFTQGERLMDHYLNNVVGNPMETPSPQAI